MDLCQVWGLFYQKKKTTQKRKRGNRKLTLPAHHQRPSPPPPPKPNLSWTGRRETPPEKKFTCLCPLNHEPETPAHQSWPLDLLSLADWLLGDGKKQGWVPQEYPTDSHRGAHVTFWPCRWHLGSADISPTMGRWHSRKILGANLQNPPSLSPPRPVRLCPCRESSHYTPFSTEKGNQVAQPQLCSEGKAAIYFLRWTGRLQYSPLYFLDKSAFIIKYIELEDCTRGVHFI